MLADLRLILTKLACSWLQRGVGFALSSLAHWLMFSLPARWILLSALTIALVGYGFDCLGMTTPEQSMECCNRMRCHSHHHSKQSQDCCNTTPQAHADLGNPSSLQSISYSPIALGCVHAPAHVELIGFFGTVITRHSHDPPHRDTPVLPLRI